MNKLHIQRIRVYNAYWFAIRFVGCEQSFRAMTAHFRSYGIRGAYWRQGEFGGKGGWIVRTDILKNHTNRFDNLQTSMDESLARYLSGQESF